MSMYAQFMCGYLNVSNEKICVGKPVCILVILTASNVFVPMLSSFTEQRICLSTGRPAGVLKASHSVGLLC